MDETVDAAVLGIRHELAKCYKYRHRLHPQEGLTKITRFYKKTIGDANTKVLKTKGAEPCLFLFLLRALRTKGVALGHGGQILLGAGAALECTVHVYNVNGRLLSPAHIQQCFYHWNR